MTGESQPLQDHLIVQVRRPSPALVSEIGERLSETINRVRRPALVAAIQRETGCSRATAYRAMQDFLEERRAVGPPLSERRGRGGRTRRRRHWDPRRSTLIRGVCLLALVATVTAASTIRSTTDPAMGAYARLSPLQQRIVEAFFRAEGAPATSREVTRPTPLSRDQIAGIKASGQGWQQVFDQLKAAGLIQEENLRQVLKKYYSTAGRPSSSSMTETAVPDDERLGGRVR